MNRTGLRVLQVAVAALAGVVAGLVWLGLTDDGGGANPDEAVATRATVSPSSHTFGERVVATLDTTVDTAQVVPESVRFDGEFAPYEVVGEPVVTRETAGRAARARYSFTLRCIREGCDPATDGTAIELPTGRVVYRFRGTAGRAVEPIEWPPIEVASVVTDDDLEAIRWEASERSLPAATTRVAPGVLAVALFGGAAALAAGALLLGRRLTGDDEVAEAVVDEGPTRTALEQALAAAVTTSANGSVEERQRALERAARELVDVGRPDLAAEARALAWAPAGSTREDVERLASDALQAVGT